MTTFQSINANGYDDEVEDAVPVHETHQARCTLCTWEGESFDEMGWKQAQEEAVEHYEDTHREYEDDDEESE